MKYRYKLGHDMRHMLIDEEGRIVAFVVPSMYGVYYVKHPLMDTIIGAFESGEAARAWAEKNLQ